jgi:hypothetical protein
MRLVLMWHYAPGAWASIDYYNGTTDATAAAMLLRVADNATLAFSEDGSGVMVSAAGAEYQAIGGESGLIAVARSLTWLGSNPAHWTTNAVG